VLSSPVYIGVSLKMYFGYRDGAEWFRRVAATSAAHPAVLRGDVVLFVLPSHLQVVSALDVFHDTPVVVGAQDGAAEDSGAYTGEVSASELSEVGVRLVEVGHAERRDLFGEDDGTVAAKTSAILRNGMTPLICLGEPAGLSSREASRFVVAQLISALESAPAGPVLAAYEPKWAIGADAPASAARISEVCGSLRDVLDGLGHREGSAVIYGGAAQPGLLAQIGEHVDGLFLGRFAHDPDALLDVIEEAASLISPGAPRGTRPFRAALDPDRPSSNGRIRP
jgi:triosephosphate isomerase